MYLKTLSQNFGRLREVCPFRRLIVIFFCLLLVIKGRNNGLLIDSLGISTSFCSFLNQFRILEIRDKVHNISLHGRTKEIGLLIGDQTGVCVEVDTNENGKCTGKFFCIWVLLDILKPLRHGARIRLGLDHSM